MAQPQLAVKIVSNTAELIANLNAGKGAIESYGPSIAKMQETWARNGALVVEKAATITAAMKDVSVSTLTVADAAKNLKQLDAGLAQLKQTGQPIPPLMQQTADKLRAVDDAAKGGVGSSANLLGTLTKIGAAVGIAFSAQAVVGFVGRVIDSASHVQDLAAQLKVSTDAVQRWDYAIKLSGGTIDDVERALSFMNKSLGAGENSTREALADAGLEFSKIRAMKPEEAFEVTVTAVSKMTDAMKQAEVQQELFGKGGKAMLAAMAEGFVETGRSADVMSAETIRRLDDAGDAWTKLGNKVTIISGEMIASVSKMLTAWNSPEEKEYAARFFAALHLDTKQASEDLQDLGRWAEAAVGSLGKLPKVGADPRAVGAGVVMPKFDVAALLAEGDALDKKREAMNKATEAAKRHADAIDALFKKYSGANATAAMKDLDVVFRRLASSGQLTRDQIDAIVKEAIKLQGEGATLTDRLYEMARVTNALHPSLKLTALNLKDIGTEVAVNASHVDAYVKAVAQLGAMSKTITVGSLTFGGNKDIDIGKPIIPKAPRQSIWEGMFGTSAEMGQYLAQTITGAFQGGGDALKSGISAIGSMAMGNLGKSLVGTVDKAGPLFNSALGKVFAGALPIIGSLIGPLAGAIWNKLFGTAGRDAVKDFAATFTGGFDGPDGLHEALNALGAEGERLWIKLTQGTGRNNPAQAKATIEEITAALAKQKEKTAEVAAAAAESSAAQQAALDAISEKYSGAISKLESEYRSLSDSVSKEAAEEFMGIVETQERARMEQIEAEKAAQIIMRDAEIAAKQETFDQVLAAGTDTYNELRRIFGQGLDIPTRYGVPGFQTGSGYGYVPSGVPTSSRDSGYSGGASSSRASTSGAGDTQVTVVMPDGDVLLKAVVKAKDRRGW